MKLSELGEFELIDQIRKRFKGYYKGSLTGIGDDCAILPKNESESILVTCDTLVENIHFFRSKIEPEHLGYKSLAVNISDIAAMGGKAEYAFLSLALPGETSGSWINRYFDGFHDLARDEHLMLLGGDTTKSPNHITITVTLIGSVETKHIKRRSDAKPGDLICVTGYLGDSAGGLNLLLENREVRDEHERALVDIHNRPKAFHDEGRWFSTQQAIHAMMDVSDGIASDASHIANASDMLLHIDAKKLPLSDALKITSAKYGWDILQLAVSGGEDYVLLCTIDPEDFDRIQDTYRKKFGNSLYVIGSVLEGKAGVEFFNKGNKISLSGGFDHFKKNT